MYRSLLLREYVGSPTKNLRSYSFDKTSSVVSRIQPAPDFVVSYLQQMDKATDYSSYVPTEAELRMIEGYLTNLPQVTREVLRERLVAIYFIQNFRGAGLTDFVLDDAQGLYVIMVFNPDTLKMDLSQWLTFRESSCFLWSMSGEQLEINAGTGYTGFLYALVHESAHAVDYVKAYTPYPERSISILQGNTRKTTPFVARIWNDLYTPAPQYDFPGRKAVAFYGLRLPELSIADAGRIYELLSDTPFVSLYGSTSWAEDFADTVMFYHLTQKLGQPYEIRFTNSVGELKTFRPLESKLVRERFQHIQGLYQAGGSK